MHRLYERATSAHRHERAFAAGCWGTPRSAICVGADGSTRALTTAPNERCHVTSWRALLVRCPLPFRMTGEATEQCREAARCKAWLRTTETTVGLQCACSFPTHTTMRRMRTWSGTFGGSCGGTGWMRRQT